MRPLILATLVCVGVATPLTAQTHALVVFGQAGRYAGMANLSGSGDDFAPAFSLGGGLALQVGPTAAIRASFTRVATRFRGTATGFADSSAARTYLGLDFEAGWPGTSNVVPYVLFGGGAAHTRPAETGAAGATQPAAHVGAGFNVIGGPLVFYAEASGWAYKFAGYGYSRLQVDLFVQVGTAIAIPF